MTVSRSDALVLFGVTGDLAHKMIFPALYAMAKRGALKVPVIGVAFPKWSLARLHKRVTDSIERSGGIDNQRALHHLLSLLRYVNGDYEDPGTFTAIKKGVGQRSTSGALPRHSAFPLRDGDQRTRGRKPGRACARHRRKAVRTRPGLRAGAQPRRAHGVPGRLDLPHRSLPREGGDHEYPLFPLRQFVSGADLEPQLRGQRPDNPIRGLRREGRGAFYETAGCLRDVIQNHLFQIVALLAMEPPAGRDFGAVHSEKAKVFQAMRPLQPDDLVRGQYAGYRKEPDVAKSSDVETFCALRLFIDSWRWEGVPWYLRSGKYLAETATEVLVELKPPPQRLFADSAPTIGRANYLRFRLSPSAAVALAARVKLAGKEFVGDQRELYLLEERPGEETPYERLLGDAMIGDGALFTREDAVEAAWAVVDPVLKTHHRVRPYKRRSWGPKEADAIIASGGCWHNPDPNRNPDDEPAL